MQELCWGIVWGCLIAFPHVALLTLLWTKRCFRLRRHMISGSIFTLCFLCAAIILRIRFANVLANICCLMFAYFTYCWLAACCWTIRPKIVRIPAVLIAMIPIAFGCFMSTIGILGLGFILADYTSAPLHEEEFQPNLLCVVNEWGNAISDSGYHVHLYEFWPSMPFLIRQVEYLSVDEVTKDPPKTCNDALKLYTHFV